MEIVQLKDLTDIYLGVTHTPEYVWDGVPFLSVKDISGGNIVFDNCKYISEEEYNSLSEGAKPKVGDMLFCRVGTIGKPIIIPEGTPKFGSFVSLGYLRNKDSSRCKLEYLKHWMNSKSFFQQVQSNVKGASQVNLNTGWLSKFEVPLPELNDQCHIVEILNKCEEVINIRNLELYKLDELIKARFVEMFGDPVINPYGLPMMTLGELSELITKGASPSWQGFSYTDDNSQTLFVTSENVREGYLDLSSPKYIEDGFNEKQKRSMIYKGDFLINIVGASIGRAAQFNLDCKANMNQAAALVRVNDDRIRDKYLLIYLNSEKAQHMYNSMKSDTGRANLSLQDINDLSIMIPPVDKQIEYELFVEQVDKSKVIEVFITFIINRRRVWDWLRLQAQNQCGGL